MGLTKRQQLFVREYCDNPGLTQAEVARRAGFSSKRAAVSGSEMMRNVEVQREIERRLKGAVKRAVITPDTVLADLEDIADMCKSAGAGSWQAATLVKVAELKGKYLKMFVDRTEISLDSDLIARLEAGRKRAGLPQVEPKTLPAEIVEENPETTEEPVQ